MSAPDPNESAELDQPLSRLAPHACGVVTHVEADDEDMDRLMAMGVCGGRTVELIQRGDPLIIRVVGTRIGLSARLAQKVWVNADTRIGCPIHPQAEEPTS